MIVDDDPNLLEGMREAIPWHELDVEWIGEGMDGREGLQLTLNEVPDIVICDIDMPVMDGLEMIEQLRKNDYSGKIVVLSGHSDFEYARQALRLSVEDYLSKPISLESLKLVIRKVTDALCEDRLQKNELEKNERQMKQSLRYMMNEWGKKLLLDMQHEPAMELDLISYKLKRWASQCHVVIIVELERILLWEGDMEDLFHSALQHDHVEYDVIVLNAYQYVIVVHMNDDLIEHEMEKLVTGIGAYFKKQWEIEVKIGIGTVQSDWRTVSRSFEEAFQMINNDYASQSSGEEGSELRRFRFYHLLAQAIRNMNEEQISSLISEHMTLIVQRGSLHKTEVSRFENQLLTIIAFTLYDIGVELSEILLPELSKPEREPYYSQQSVTAWLESIVNSIIQHMNMNTHVNNRHKKIVEVIKQYTDLHYMEDLTLSSMAEIVQISKNYLGQIFKNVVNETYNSYLTRIRMEKARQILLEGNLYIYEVAEKVGYNSISYFSVQFKKYTGLNPTDVK